MKHIYIYITILIGLLLLGVGVYAQNNGSQFADSDLISQLAEQGIDTQNIRNRSRINRYEYTRLLSTLDCQQCSPATPTLTKTLTERNNNRNTAQTNLDDLELGNMLYKDEDVSYCVAHIASHGWMNGFPRGSSPLCPGKFCGSNTLVFGDLIQSLYMYSAPQHLSSLDIDRVAVGTWVQSLGENIDIPTQQIVAGALDRCREDICSPISTGEADVYARYCQYNLSACRMNTTDTLKQNAYPLGHINLLHDRGILDRNHEVLQSLGRYDAVPGEFLMDIYLPLITAAQCPVLVDFDNDGIRNSQDLCMLVYDPQQRDLDNDKVGDVCDQDIDGDGILNEIGAVDDAGHIDIQKWSTHEDNCLFTKNTGQEDDNSNTKGDSCEGQKYRTPLTISLDTSSAKVGEKITATASEEHDHIIRSRGSANSGKKSGQSDAHIYDATGVYTLVARSYDLADDYIYSPTQQTTTCPHLAEKSCIISIVKTPVYIGSQGELAAGLLGYSDPISGKVGDEILLKHNLTGNIAKLIRTVGANKIEATPGEDVSYMFGASGLYTIQVEGYSPTNERVGLSQIGLEIQETESKLPRAAYISTEALQHNLNDIISLDTVYSGFDLAQVETVTWSMGEDLIKETESLDTTLRLTRPGHVLIEQTISFSDIYPNLTQYISIHIQEPDTNNTSALTVEPLSTLHHTTVSGQIQTNIDLDDVYTLDRDRGDGNKSYMTDQDISLQNTHIYTSPGTYRIRTVMIDTDTNAYIHEQMVNITSGDLCQQHATGDIQLICDMDNDDIPDLCDDDIDGDGVENLMGILLRESSDCKIIAGNIDPDRFQQQIDISKAALQKPDAYIKKDNCFVVINPEQSDNDSDGLGDICDNTPTPSDPGGDDAGGGSSDSGGNNSGEDGSDNGGGDSDGDGTPDSSDSCPGIPGGGGGCPDITPPQDPNDSGIPDLEENNLRADTCTECPCPFVDYAAEVLPGDRVRAVLVDPAEERVYSISQPEIVRE